MNFIVNFSMITLICLLALVGVAGWSLWMVVLFSLAGLGYSVAWTFHMGRRLFLGAMQLCR